VAPAPVISVEIMFCKLTKQAILASKFLVQYASFTFSYLIHVMHDEFENVR
jgi:hypothetical protein